MNEKSVTCKGNFTALTSHRVNAVLKEIGQLHDRECFDPTNIKDLMEKEKQQAQIALTYLTEKRYKTIKARTVYNGKPTREWLSHEELASPTASIEGMFLTALMDAWEQQHAMSSDTPNAFAQAKLNRNHGQA